MIHSVTVLWPLEIVHVVAREVDSPVSQSNEPKRRRCCELRALVIEQSGVWLSVISFDRGSSLVLKRTFHFGSSNFGSSHFGSRRPLLSRGPSVLVGFSFAFS